MLPCFPMKLERGKTNRRKEEKGMERVERQAQGRRENKAHQVVCCSQEYRFKIN